MMEYLSYKEVDALSDLEVIKLAKDVLENSKRVPDTEEKYRSLYIWQYYLKKRFNGPVSEYRDYSGEALSLYSDYLSERKRILSLIEIDKSKK